MSEVVVSLVVNLANDRMKIKRIEYEKELKSHKLTDRKETGALIAGYDK